MEANQQRAVVIAEQARLSEDRAELPDESQGIVEEAIEKIQQYLDSRPEFPPPLVHNETARKEYTKRLARGQTASEI